MKKALRIFGVYLFLALYGFAIGVVALAPAKTSVSNLEGKSFSVRLDASAAKLYSLDVQIGSFSVKQISALDFGSKGDAEEVLLERHNCVLSANFEQYIGFFKDFRINLQKTHLLFPFHYFW